MRNCVWFFWSFQLGPNVSISANARIGPGVRLIGCIILDGVEVKVSIFTVKVTN
jgi:NDP-sugar pyrophosphorylase family protein